MRVDGKGAGFSGERNPGRDRGKRVEQFRRERRVGEEVRGKMLGFEAPGLARVLIEGREMFAKVGGNPVPGQIMLFLVVALYPEIVLKELPAKGRATRDMAPLANELDRRRAALEALLGETAQPQPEDLPADILKRRTMFLSRLESTPKALALFKEIQAVCQEANAFLAQGGRGRFHYLPWLLPGMAGQEALIRRTRRTVDKKKGQAGESAILWDVQFNFEHKEAGRCALHILYARPRARYRLALERPQAAKSLIPLFKDLRLGHVAIEQECLGVGALPASSGSGLLAGALAALTRSRQSFTGINLQV